MTEPCKPKGWWATLWGVPGAIWRAMMAAESVKGWFTIFGGMAVTLLFVGLAWAIWKGPWLESHQGKQIDWLGYGMVLAGLMILVNQGSIAGMAISLRASKDGVSASIDRDEPEPIKVTTTTETTVTPGAADGELPLDQRVNP